jgi:hypothetical protein
MSPSQGRYTTQTQISMPQVGFELTIPVLERPKTIYALDRAAGHCDRHHYPLMFYNSKLPTVYHGSRNSAVAIAIVYKLDDRRDGIRVPVW